MCWNGQHCWGWKRWVKTWAGQTDRGQLLKNVEGQCENRDFLEEWKAMKIFNRGEMPLHLSAVHRTDWNSWDWGQRHKIKSTCHNPREECWQPKLRQFQFQKVHGPNWTIGDVSEYSESLTRNSNARVHGASSLTIYLCGPNLNFLKYNNYSNKNSLHLCKYYKWQCLLT